MFKPFVTAVALSLMAAGAHAATLVAFSGVNGASVPASIEATGVTGFNLGRSIGVTERAGSTFNSRDWEEGTDKLTALANNNAIFWGATISGATPYDLTSLTIDYDRSALGPQSIAIDLFINNIFQAEIFSNNAVADSGTQEDTIDLSAFTNVTGSLFFRLVGWDSSDSRGTFDIENDLAGGFGIIVEGERASPAVIPLPAGLPLMLAGLGAFGLVRRRQS